MSPSLGWLCAPNGRGTGLGYALNSSDSVFPTQRVQLHSRLFKKVLTTVTKSVGAFKPQNLVGPIPGVFQGKTDSACMAIA